MEGSPVRGVEQDRRVIDALSAAAMVVEHSTRAVPKPGRCTKTAPSCSRQLDDRKDICMWPFRKKALTGTQPVLDALSDRTWAPWPLVGRRVASAHHGRVQHGPVRELRVDLHQQPAVRTVVDVLVRNIGQLDLRLYEEVDESERQPKPDHPAALSLRYPSETVTSDGLIRSLFKDFLLFDNAYALLIPAPGNQISLFRLPAHMVEIRGASLFVAEGYRVHLRDGTFADYTPEQILHWCGENPTTRGWVCRGWTRCGR
jgi:phage portal protein BeeE